MSLRTAVASVALAVALAGCTPSPGTRGPEDPVVVGASGEAAREPTARLGSTLSYAGAGIEVRVGHPRVLATSTSQRLTFEVTVRNGSDRPLDPSHLAFFLVAGSETATGEPLGADEAPADVDVATDERRTLPVVFEISDSAPTTDLVVQVDLGLPRLSPAVFTS